MILPGNTFRIKRIYFYKNITLLFLFFNLTSCGLFLSPYSQHSYINFTQLKVLHIKFIETFTETGDNEYELEKLKEFYDEIDIKFREAIEYEKQVTDDNTRLEAFEILYDEFNANYNQLISLGSLFSIAFSEEIKGEVEKNYNLAIEGELSRRNSPTN